MDAVTSPDRDEIAAVPTPTSGPDERHQIVWWRYAAASVAVGVAFMLFDAVVNANPLAEQAYAVYTPIARTGLNLVAAIAIDLAYGFVLSAIFLVLYPAMPGGSRILKGLSFAILLWLLRVVMSAAGQWVLFAIPAITVGYTLASGLIEMLVLGFLVAMLSRGIQSASSDPRGGAVS